MSMCTLARGCYGQPGLRWHRTATHKRNYSKQTSVASSARPCCVTPSFFFARLFKHVKTSLSHNSMVILQYKSPKPERKEVTRRCTLQLPRQDGRDKKPSGAGCWRIPTLEPRMRKRARFRRAATSRPSFSPVEIVSQFSVT